MSDEKVKSDLKMDNVFKRLGKETNDIWNNNIDAQKFQIRIEKDSNQKEIIDKKNLNNQFLKKFNLKKTSEKIGGVYLIYVDSSLFYVGESLNILSRLKRHFNKPYREVKEAQEKRIAPFRTILQNKELEVVVLRIIDNEYLPFRKSLEKILEYNKLPAFLNYLYGMPSQRESVKTRVKTSYRLTNK